MSEMLKTGIEWLADQLNTFNARTVTYRRGARTVDVTATIARSLFDIQEDGNLRREFTDRDFLIDVAALVLSGVQVEPQIGDRITDTNDVVTRVYEVLAPDGQTPAQADPFWVKWRIRTKRIS